MNITTTTTKNIELTKGEMETLWQAAFLLQDLIKVIESEQGDGLIGWQGYKFQCDKLQNTLRDISMLVCSADNDIFKVF